MREQQDWLLGMIDKLLRQIRLIERDQRDGVSAGNVFRGDDSELFPRHAGFEMDTSDSPARNRTPYGGPVEHARKLQVVDIFRTPRYLVSTFLPRNGATYGGLHYS